MKRSRKVFEETETVIREGGEIIETRKRTKRVVSSEHFIKLYLEDLTALLGISQPLHFKVLFCIAKRIEYATNQIILIKKNKDEIAKEICCQSKSVSNAISFLTQKGLLIRSDRVVYLLNPKLFFKGEEIDKAKVLKFILEYRFGDNREWDKPTAQIAARS